LSYIPPSPQNFGGGVTAVVYNISKELIKRGHEVTIYTSAALNVQKKMDNIDNPTIIDGIEVYYFPYIMHHYTFFITPSLIPYIRKSIKNFDLIHLHDNRSFQAIPVHHYAKKYETPYVFQAHGNVLPLFRIRHLKKLYDLVWGYKILKDAKKVIALTEIEAEQYKKMGVDENKIEIIPNGIDFSQYKKLPLRGSFKKKFNISEDKEIILG
jgi:glycosyltransferase involved in cell wall biosynthesis